MRRALAIGLTLLLAAVVDAAGQADPAGKPIPTRVDSLLAEARLQEAAWAARALGDTARADAILATLDSVLRSPPLLAKPRDPETQGVSYTFRLHHEGGVSSIFKVDGSDLFCPSCGTGREVAVYRVDRLLGLDLTPMTVERAIVQDGDTLRGSAMYFVSGASRPTDVGAAKPDLLRFMDAVIGNSDRHGGNWLVRTDGSVAAIDHNRAFEYRPTTRPKTCWETEVDSIRAPGALGPAYDRYRTLPADSLAAAVEPYLDPGMVRTFVAMRERVVDRIERRIRNPRRQLPREDCPWEP